MAIAKLETVVIHRVQDWFWQNCYQVTPTTDKTVDKINEIIDYLNSQNHIPDYSGKVEQEPNKVELVPLDVEKIMSEIRLRCPLTMPWNYGIIIEILSQYWVPTPKKFTQWVVWERLVKSGRISYENDAKERYWVDMLYSFLTEKWLLEE